MDKLFPEIRDPLREQAGVRKDIAMMHPKALMADQIIAYREQARILRDANQVANAEIYEKLADSLESELIAPEQPQQQVSRRAESGMIPKELTEPVEGMGRLT